MSSSKETEKPEAAHPRGGAPAWLFSVAGVGLVFALLIAINVIVGKAVPIQVDLTEDKLYTLSEGTRDILKGLDTDVTLTFFASEDEDNVPPVLTLHRRKVDAMLMSFESAAKGGRLKIERLDPEPDSLAEDRARNNEIQRLPGRFDDPVYFGLTATCLDRKSTIAMLDPRREALMEFEIARAIVEVSRSSVPKVAIMSPLPVAGTPSMPFGPQQGGPPQWTFHRSLGRAFDPDPNEPGNNLVDLGMDIDEIPEDIEVVVLIHPAGISKTTEFALDQFVLRGGRLVAFLDAHSFFAEWSRPRPQQPNFGQPPPAGVPVSSDLKTLLPAWGVNFEANQVLADLAYQTVDIIRGVPSASALQIPGDGIDSEDRLTRKLRHLFMYNAGAFYVDKKDGISAEVLVDSTERSQLVNSTEAFTNPTGVIEDFSPSEKIYPLVVRLSGSFKTAFPDGKPKAESEDGEEAEEEDDEAGEYLEESEKETNVILVADSDMIVDFFALRLGRGGQILGYANHNLPFAMRAVEQAAGGASLVSISNRGSTERPFKKFKELEAEASKKYNAQLEQVRTDIKDAQLNLEKVVAKATKEAQEEAAERGEEGMLLVEVQLPPHVQAEQEAVAKKVKDLRATESRLKRELRKDIRGMENKIKNWNIAGIPILVALIGVAHLVIRRIRISAR